MHVSYAALAINWQYPVCMFVWFMVEIGLGQYAYSGQISYLHSLGYCVKWRKPDNPVYTCEHNNYNAWSVGHKVMSAIHCIIEQVLMKELL